MLELILCILFLYGSGNFQYWDFVQTKGLYMQNYYCGSLSESYWDYAGDEKPIRIGLSLFIPEEEWIPALLSG